VAQRSLILPFFLMLGLWGIAQPVRSQALIPHTLQLDPKQLEEIGTSLIQEADRWTRFQEYQQALPHAKLAAQLVPDNPQAWEVLGNIYVQLGDTTAGIAALEKARTLEPDNATVLFSLGFAYFQQDDFARAIEEFQAGLQIDPDVPGVYFDLGNAYYRQGETDRALASYQQAIERDAKFWPAVNNMGLVKYELGEIDEAIRLWEQAVGIEDVAEPKLALAIALYIQGQQERGFELGEAALQLDRRYAEIEFLKENLWGDRLLSDAATFIQTPRIQASLDEVPPPTPAPAPTGGSSKGGSSQ
jgi:tetratricopeptide (TPR) repeat protein